MEAYEQLTKNLSGLPSLKWALKYFDLVKKLFTDLDIGPSDPRLALTLPKNGIMPVNLGQRYVLCPRNDGYTGCIVPVDFDTEAVKGFEVFFFSHKGVNDAKFIDIPLHEKKLFSEYAYAACMEESDKILRSCTKSGYRKYHVPMLYDFIMETSVRNEIIQLTGLKDR
ncbi:MAG: hypothetical protein QM763_08145 [Agriterribacter sp.]